MEELDRPSLNELALPGELGLLALHRLPNFLGDFARRAMRRDEALFRHRSETLAQIGHATLDLTAGLFFLPRPGAGPRPLLFSAARRLPRPPLALLRPP